MHIQNTLIKKPVRAVLAAVLVLSLVAAPAISFAATANTAVGQVTANQAPGACNDLGAVVYVSVSGGFANTAYNVNAVRVANGPTNFTTNGSGAGSSSLVNVKPDAGGNSGNATVTFTANGQSGQVVVNLSCVGGKGH